MTTVYFLDFDVSTIFDMADPYFITVSTLGNEKELGSESNPLSWTELFTSKISVTMYYMGVGKNRLYVPSCPISYCSSFPLIWSICSKILCSCGDFRSNGICFIRRPKDRDLVPRKMWIRSVIMSGLSIWDYTYTQAFLPDVRMTECGPFDITQSCVKELSDRNPDL